MRISKNKILYSPTDLNNFVSCKYHIKNDLLADEKKFKKREISADLKLRIKYGIEHETKHFKLFKNKNNPNVTINNKLTDEKRFEATKQALTKGYKLIYKAYFIEKNFRGEADFLLRVNTKSDLGNYSYEVYDTKITKNLRPKHVLQITGYSYLLGKLQNLLPRHMYLIDGNNKFNPYKVNEFIDYFTYTRNRFENILPTLKKSDIYPEKCSYCQYCPWLDVCEKRWGDDNYINQVARIRKSQVVKLKKEKIKTVEALAKTSANKIKSKINQSTKIRLVQQAKLQEEKRLTGKSKFIFNETEVGRGFYKLPKENEGDIFYDIEGFPQSEKRPFEYLHGIFYLNGKKQEYKNFTVKKYQQGEEKRIFVELIHFLKKHFDKYPDAFIYHYNDYEKRALKDLSNEYSSTFPDGVNLIDKLLRQEKFIDLFRVVEQCMQTSEKDLSLKTIEKFYRKERSAKIKTADDSIRLFDDWCATNDQKLMKDIISYNEEDCVSTYDLREFLCKNKPDNIPDFSQSDEEKDMNSEFKDFEKREIDLINQLEKKRNKENTKMVDDLISLVGFHRREAKPDIWAYYDRMEKSPEELEDDPECIGNCIFIKEIAEENPKRRRFKYKFNDQNFKIKEGEYASDIFEKGIGRIEKIEEIDENENFIEISIEKKRLALRNGMPKVANLGPPSSPRTGVISAALYKFIEDFSDNKKTKYKCIEDFLKNNYPDIKSLKSGGTIIDYSKDIIDQSINAVKKLNSSFLLIQGPPGAGKTYTSAKIILSLIKDKKKVGINSNSHKAINNLLLKIEELAAEENFKFEGFKKSSKEVDKFNGKNIRESRIELVTKNCLIYAGTAWLFSDARLDQQLDYVFIDEAGQVSLANSIAIATTTKNIVLIGDQMQLSQPIKGTHSKNSGKSSLNFLLEDHDTIPLNRGIFLDKTRRLNEKICKYVSDSFYESRLKPHAITYERKVSLSLKDIGNEGIYYLPASHSDCTQRSDEEANTIKTIFNKIKGKEITESGKNSKITNDDVMVVAPFNMQVNHLTKVLGKGSRVGTIDKFQGQEAKVVFISMTSSDPENIPRHKEFFFSRNRLNVAISRAECVAVILFNPNLLLTQCQKINEMRLINNFCKLLKYEC